MSNMGGCGCGVPYKSVVWAIVLPLILGPLGVLYINYIVSIVLMILMGIGLAIGKMPGGILCFVVWMVGIYWSGIATERYNRCLYKKAICCDTAQACK